MRLTTGFFLLLAHYNIVIGGDHCMKEHSSQNATEMLHLDTIAMWRGQYEAFFHAKKYDEAFPLAWKIYKLRENLLGKEDPDTVDSLAELANIYYMKKKYQKAEELMKRAYRLTKSRLGQNHKTTIQFLFILADVYRMTPNPNPNPHQGPNQYSEKRALALRYFRKVYDVRSKDPDLGQEHEDTVQVLKSIGDVLGILGRLTEAAEIFQRVLEIRTRKLGEDHPLTLEAKEGLFIALANSGKTGQAKRIYGNADQNPDEHDESLFILVEGKVSALVDQRKYEKAIEIMTEFYEHEVLKPQIHVKILTILDKLVLYSRQVEVLEEDLDQNLKWANVAIDLIQRQEQTKKVKLTSKEDVENMQIVFLHSVTSSIIVYSKMKDEEKIDAIFKMAVQFLQTSSSSKGHDVDDSSRIFEIFWSIMERVIDFKERILGKADYEMELYAYVAKNVRHEDLSLSLIGTLVNMAVEKKDYKMLVDVALEYFNNAKEESGGRLKMREETTNIVFFKAQEQSDLGNYEMSLTLYKTMEAIWPDKWSKNVELTAHFLAGILKCSFRLNKPDVAFFYMEKQITLFKTELKSIRIDPKVDKEAVTKIKSAITSIEKSQEDLKEWSKLNGLVEKLQSVGDILELDSNQETSKKYRNEL